MRSGSVQQHPLICSGDFEQVTHLCRIGALDVAQDQDLSLRIGQLRQTLLHPPGDLRGVESGVDRGPRLEWLGPVTTGIEAAVEPVSIVERGVARLAHSGRLGTVDEDPEQPGLHRAAALESMDSLHHTKPCVLNDLFRYSTRRHERLGEPQHPRVVAADERGERGIVAHAQRVEQLHVRVTHGARRYICGDLRPRRAPSRTRRGRVPR